MKILGISGKSRHGKDAIAERLVESHGFVRIALADALKAGAAAIFGLTQDQLYGSTKEVIDPRWGKSPRQILQLLGTEAIRNVFGDDTWIRALRVKIDDVGPSHVHMPGSGGCIRCGAQEIAGRCRVVGVVIPDVRFPNEADAVLGWGGQVWRVVRPGVPAVNPHVSETALDEYESFTAHVPNTGTLADLFRHVDDLILTEK